MPVPVVLTRAEVQASLSKLEGSHKLLVALLYGCGLRLMEGLRLRVKDVDFDRGVIIVRDAKGGKDRVVMLPQSILPALKDQFRQSHLLWAQDRAQQLPGVELPHALERKYPKAGQTWACHWVFPQEAVQGLIERGHPVKVAQRFDTEFGCAQMAMKTQGGYIAASDHRKDGYPVGL